MVRAVVCAAALALVFASPASASSIFFDDFAPQQSGWSFTSPTSGYMGPLHNFYNVGSVTLTLSGLVADPNAVLEFDLLVFDTLDHDNCCRDTFTMSANSSTLFTGAFSGATFDPTVQGPVGNNFSHFFTNPSGATTTQIGTSATGTLNGFALTSGVGWHFSVPIALLGGSNTFTWSYAVNQPITSVDREAWGIDNVHVSSPAAVPEPGTLVLFGTGIAVMTAWLRRRTRASR